MKIGLLDKLNPDRLFYYNYKKSVAKECFDNESCLACGCSSKAMFLSDKPCLADKYLGKKKCF